MSIGFEEALLGINGIFVTSITGNLVLIVINLSIMVASFLRAGSFSHEYAPLNNLNA